MRIKDGFVLREVAGQAVVIATGEASKTFHGMVKLNGTGRDIWNGLAQGLDADAIAAGLVRDYDVDAARARADVDAFIAKMSAEGFLV